MGAEPTLGEVAARLRPLELPPLGGEPLVSVLIASRDYGRFLPDCLESALGQEGVRLEVLVCDDGSTDDSVEVLERYAARDRRLRYVSQANQGMAAALNAAMRMAGGDVVTLLDADDVWLPGRLARVVAAFREAGGTPALVAHAVRPVREDGRTIVPAHPQQMAGGWLGPALVRGEEPALPPCSGLAVHGEVARWLFPLPEELRSHADVAVRERAALTGPVRVVGEALALYRQHGSNLTGLDGPWTLEGVRNQLAVYERIWRSRADYLYSRHGLRLKPGQWTLAEGTQLLLAWSALSATPAPPAALATLRPAARRWVWRVLLRLPPETVSRVLRLWWRERWWKQLARRCLVRPGAGLERGSADVPG